MSLFGAARVSDPVFCEGDVHGIAPFLIILPVLGRITEGSFDTIINDRPAARVGDAGMHKACPGPNTFLLVGGASRTFINDRPAVRETDPSMHCGGLGENPGSSVGSVMDGLGSPNTLIETGA